MNIKKFSIGLVLSILAGSAFALPNVDVRKSDASTHSVLVAEGGSKHTNAGFRQASDGADRVGSNRLAADGADRVGANRQAADGSDHIGANRLAEDGADRVGANRTS